jgi:hypothetical protein
MVFLSPWMADNTLLSQKDRRRCRNTRRLVRSLPGCAILHRSSGNGNSIQVMTYDDETDLETSRPLRELLGHQVPPQYSDLAPRGAVSAREFARLMRRCTLADAARFMAAAAVPVATAAFFAAFIVYSVQERLD